MRFGPRSDLLSSGNRKMSDSVIHGRYGNLDLSSIVATINIDRALTSPHARDLTGLTLATFGAPSESKHRDFIDSAHDISTHLVAINLFTTYAHELRHYHDLLASPYGTFLVRERIRAILYSLPVALQIEAFWPTIYVPVGDWVRNYKLLKKAFAELDPPPLGAENMDADVAKIKKTMSEARAGIVPLPPNKKVELPRFDATTILESLAVETQVTVLKRQFGDALTGIFILSLSGSLSTERYYETRYLIGQNGVRDPESVNLVLFASLCGMIDSRKNGTSDYPPDLLIRLLAWLKRQGRGGGDPSAVFVAIEDFWQDYRGETLAETFHNDVERNQQSARVFREYIDGLNSPQATVIVKAFEEFLLDRALLLDCILPDIPGYCSTKYIDNQLSYPLPPLFIESHIGLPLRALGWEKDYQVHFDSTVTCDELPEALRWAQPATATPQELRLAHISCPAPGHRARGRESWHLAFPTLSIARYFNEGCRSEIDYFEKDFEFNLRQTGTRIFAAAEERNITEISVSELQYQQPSPGGREHFSNRNAQVMLQAMRDAKAERQFIREVVLPKRATL